MDIAIVGLPMSGKTTIFNAVTRGTAQVGVQTGGRGKPNLGVAKVPDGRLDTLAEIFNPKRTVSAEITYVDIPAPPEGLGSTRGISGEYLNDLQRADALFLVVRAFEDPSVAHVTGSVDPFRDVETMEYELVFSDLEILERRLGRVAEQFKGAKAPEREALNSEQALLSRLKEALEAGTPIRDQSLQQDERRQISGFQLLTAKPLIVVANVGEDQLPEPAAIEQRLSSQLAGSRVRATALCGKLEMELSQMEPSEEQEFRQSLELAESGLERMVRLSHDVSEVITFFTGNANEVRAWTIPEGTTALKAAGGVHSDMERGFIRAEVVKFDELQRCGSVAEARKQGVLRQEGKGYEVQEGDVINVLFNV